MHQGCRLLKAKPWPCYHFCPLRQALSHHRESLIISSKQRLPRQSYPDPQFPKVTNKSQSNHSHKATKANKNSKLQGNTFKKVNLNSTNSPPPYSIITTNKRGKVTNQHSAIKHSYLYQASCSSSSKYLLNNKSLQW